MSLSLLERGRQQPCCGRNGGGGRNNVGYGGVALARRSTTGSSRCCWGQEQQRSCNNNNDIRNAVIIVPESTTDEGDVVHVMDALHRPITEDVVTGDISRFSCTSSDDRICSSRSSGRREAGITPCRFSSPTVLYANIPDSKFGGFGSRGDKKGGKNDDDDDEYDMTTTTTIAAARNGTAAPIMGDEELVDRPASSVNSKPVSINVPSKGMGTLEKDVPADFDVCKEYGYRYEYTEDDEEDSDNDDDNYNHHNHDHAFHNNDRDNNHHSAAVNSKQTNKTPGRRLTSSQRQQQSFPLVPSSSTPSSALPQILQDVSTALATSLCDFDSSVIDGLTTSAADAATMSPTYLLGKTYHPLHDYAPRREYESSLLWFTYRSDFPEIQPYGLTTDAGWGCMLRSAQMMLCQSLRLHYFGRDWTPPKSLVQCRSNMFVQSVLTWFADFPSVNECFYSLHNMVAAGVSRYETLPGEWYGPGTACYVLRDLCEMHHQHDITSSTMKNKGTVRKNNDGKEDNELNRRRQQQDEKRNGGVKLSPLSSSLQAANGQHHLGSRPMFRVFVAQQGSVYRDAVEECMTRDNRRRMETEENESDRFVSVSVEEGMKRICHNKSRNTNNESRPTTDEPSSPPPVVPLEDPLLHPLNNYLNNDDIMNNTSPKVDWDTSLLLLIPLRLGLKTFNAESYALSLARSFSLPQSVGFIGGSPRHALWFYGATSDGSRLYGLDPHTVQCAPRKLSPKTNPNTNVDKTGMEGDTTATINLSDEYIRSIRCSTPTTIDMSRIDPSLALGFYCHDRTDFDNLCESLLELQMWSKAQNMPEFFSIADASPDYSADVSPAMEEMMMSSSSVISACDNRDGAAADVFVGRTGCGDDGGEISDEDEYVML